VLQRCAFGHCRSSRSVRHWNQTLEGRWFNVGCLNGNRLAITQKHKIKHAKINHLRHKNFAAPQNCETSFLWPCYSLTGLGIDWQTDRQTCFLTFCVQHNLEYYSRSAIWIFCLVRNAGFVIVFTRARKSSLVLSPTNLVHILSLYFMNTNFNIILPFTPDFSKRPSFFRPKCRIISILLNGVYHLNHIWRIALNTRHLLNFIPFSASFIGPRSSFNTVTSNSCNLPRVLSLVWEVTFHISTRLQKRCIDIVFFYLYIFSYRTGRHVI
jgi:hypothetical protein